MTSPPELSAQDAVHLDRARALAHRGWGMVHPNPMVGCVLVRDDAVVGEGFHAQFGGPHAEIVALEQALGSAEGATAYVSLEPCDHYGKTPPCSETLVTAGVRRVVYGAADPGSASGGGADTLRAAGVDVVGPIWSEAVSRAENPAFFHAARYRTPFVALKLAMSLDARIAAEPGRPTRITGEETEAEVHRLRSGFDAVMIGAGTARADDPRLTVRSAPPGRVATRRIVLAPGADLSTEAALFDDQPDAPIDVFCRLDAPEIAMEALESAGARVHPVAAEGPSGRLDLGAVFSACWELGVRSILCEGGAALAASLLERGDAHRLYLFVAPTALGAQGLAAFPADAHTVDWAAYTPAGPPRAFGRDTLMVLDRQEG